MNYNQLVIDILSNPKGFINDDTYLPLEVLLSLIMSDNDEVFNILCPIITSKYDNILIAQKLYERDPKYLYKILSILDLETRKSIFKELPILLNHVTMFANNDILFNDGLSLNDWKWFIYRNNRKHYMYIENPPVLMRIFYCIGL